MYNDVLYDFWDVFMEAGADVTSQIKKNGNKATPAQLELMKNIAHGLKSVKTTIAMCEAEEGNYGRRDSRGRYMSGGYSRPYMADQPERTPAYGSGNGSNLVSELERVMAQETNQRKLDMYQQMLDLAHRV